MEYTEIKWFLFCSLSILYGVYKKNENEINILFYYEVSCILFLSVLFRRLLRYVQKVNILINY